MKTSISGPSRIRQLNRTAVLAHIRLNGKNSRLQIGKELGLSAAAITSVVSELIEEGLLRKSEILVSKTNNKTQGRPISILELNPNKAFVFGILLRPIPNKKCLIEASWSDYTGNVFTLSDSVEVDSHSFKSVIDGIDTSIQYLVKKVPRDTKVYGLSIGIPGVVEKGTIHIAPKLPCIEDPKFISTLIKSYEYPVSFENDVNLGAMSELANKPYLRKLNFAYIHLYSGVGSSVVLEGKLLNGRRGWAGEIGFLKLLPSNTNNTSFEDLLGLDGILGKALRELNHKKDELHLLPSYIESGNDKALVAIDGYCIQLFNVINIIHSVVDLDEVVIDFPSTPVINLLLPKIREMIDSLRHPLKISLPIIEHQTHLHGAATNALMNSLEYIERRDK